MACPCDSFSEERIERVVDVFCCLIQRGGLKGSGMFVPQIASDCIERASPFDPSGGFCARCHMSRVGGTTDIEG